MVALGAGAAGPVLLACRQWDPRELARRLPSLGAGAWRGAPLLPWRVQCPGRVCAALPAGLGGSGRCLVSCPPRLPLSAPRFPRCVWRAVSSGCPLPSLAGMPFHAVCAFRGLGLVALLVFPACPLCVCVRSRSRCVRAPPPLPAAGVARALRAVPVLGAGRAVPLGPCPSALPAPVPSSVWFVFLLGEGGQPRPVSPIPGFRLCAPRGVGLRVWGVPAPGGGVGGGAAGVPFSRSVRPGGQWGWGSPCLGPSLCLPWAGNKAGVLDVALVMEGVAPIPFPFVLACCLRARSVWLLGVLARVRLPVVVPAGVGGWGVGAGPGPASLPGAAEGGSLPLPRGGMGAGVPVACGSVGGAGRLGGIAPWLPSSLSGGGGLRPSAEPPSRRRRIPSRCMRSAGVVGQPRAPGAACCRRASLAEVGGRSVSRPSGGWPGGRV